MPHRERETGVTVAAGETVGACLVMVRIDGQTVVATHIHWALAPLELVELLREYAARHADGYRAATAAGSPSARPPAGPPGPEGAALRLMA